MLCAIAPDAAIEAATSAVEASRPARARRRFRLDAVVDVWAAAPAARFEILLVMSSTHPTQSIGPGRYKTADQRGHAVGTYNSPVRD